MLAPQLITMVIYHSPCTDGFGSAFAAWKFFSLRQKTLDGELKKIGERVGDKIVDKVKFHPTNYGQKPPDVTGEYVLICDFSYPEAITRMMIQKAKGLLIIDHHKTAEKDLALIEDQYKIFDMKHSGAYLTWRYFFPTLPVPALISYIEDYDIWKKELPGHENFSAWFHTLPFDFELYDRYLDDDRFNLDLNTIGPAFRDLNQHYIEKACEHASLKSVRLKTQVSTPTSTKIDSTKVEDRFYLVAYLNTTILKSEIGSRLLTKYPQIDFSVVYSVSDLGEGTNFSLRSDDQHVDVSQVAKAYGGGGHRNAAGVRLSHLSNTLPGKVYPPIFEIKLDLLQPSTFRHDNKDYQVVYYFAPTDSGKIGSYLLQERYLDPVRGSIQNVMNLLKVETRFDIAIVWSYNPMANETTFNLCFDSSVPLIEQRMIIASFDNSTTITVPGLKYRLD
jgi:oligoribonuclease NrnB/cAMP/cGMP phosphodiesterase (DHH superfamily)